MTREEINQAMDEYFCGEIPEYIKGYGQSYLTILTADVVTQEPKELKVTTKDIIQYYAVESRDISSGCRTLAGHSGDWRPIDGMAKMVLEWFKKVNRAVLEREAKKRGMQLRG